MATLTTALAPAPAAGSIEELELELLLQAAFQRHGFDYRGYDREAVHRKVRALMARLALPNISALQAGVLREPAVVDALIGALYVAPASMFDDVTEVSLLRMSLGACLHGAALPRVWLADCAGAQQAWTLAILLDQMGAHSEIYATVASDALLAQATGASLPVARVEAMQDDYERCGGAGRLLDYFEVVNGESDDVGARAVLVPRLRNSITWAQYNLVTDASFNEFQVIMARRALPDFGPALRRRVLRLLDASLARSGLLVLDRPLDGQEALAGHYRQLYPLHPWYKRVA